MASDTEKRSRKSVADAAAVLSPPFNPLRDFVGPARRRTDHVVGTIVLCVGLMTVGSVVQVGATLWAGSQVKIMMENDQKRDTASENMRQSIIRYSEAQATILRRVCLNVSQSDKDRADCMVPVPEVTPKGRDR